jgi:hypothetical protein
MAFAENTTVPVERTRAEIEKLVKKYGASRFSSGWIDDGRAAISFAAQKRLVRFALQMPTMEQAQKHAHRARDWRSPTRSAQQTWIERETRRRWRCLLLVLKGKLDAVESGISSFDEQFLAHVVGPGNQTVFEMVMQAEADGQRFLSAMEGA